MRKAITLLIIFIGILSGCQKQQNTLVVGVIKPSLNHLPLDLAIDANKLDENEIEIKKFNSGWETNEALVSGQIDIAIMPFTYVWKDVAEGRNVRLLNPLERQSDGIIAKKEIKNFSDLENKKIGVLRASTLDLFLEIALEEKKVKAELVYFRSPMDMAAALKSGEVDALSYYVPSIFKLETDFNIIYWYSEDYPSHPCCSISANMDNISGREKNVKKFIEIMEKEANIIENREKHIYPLIKDNFMIDNELAVKSLENTKYSTIISQGDWDFETKTFDMILRKGYSKNNVTVDQVYYKID